MTIDEYQAHLGSYQGSARGRDGWHPLIRVSTTAQNPYFLCALLLSPEAAIVPQVERSIREDGTIEVVIQWPAQTDYISWKPGSDTMIDVVVCEK